MIKIILSANTVSRNALTAALDGTIRLWDTATGAERLRIQAGAQVGDAVLSLDGRVIASCDTANPGTANLWDAQTGSLLRVFTGTGSEASHIKGVAPSPDQTALATTHMDGRVRLWNTGLDPRSIYPITPLPSARTRLSPFARTASIASRWTPTPVAASSSRWRRTPAAVVERAKRVPGARTFLSAPAPASPPTPSSPISDHPKRTRMSALVSLQTPPPGADITAFTVVVGGTSLLQARLSAPAAVRSGRDDNLTLEYANVGDVDIAAPPDSNSSHRLPRRRRAGP